VFKDKTHRYARRNDRNKWLLSPNDPCAMIDQNMHLHLHGLWSERLRSGRKKMTQSWADFLARDAKGRSCWSKRTGDVVCSLRRASMTERCSILLFFWRIDGDVVCQQSAKPIKILALTCIFEPNSLQTTQVQWMINWSSRSLIWRKFSQMRRTTCMRVCSLREKWVKSYCSIFHCYLTKFVQPWTN
jgi:hypothetical protein